MLKKSSVPQYLIQLFPQVPENLVREVVRNFNKLIKDLQNQDAPEAMAYLRIMGAEMGYIKANELKFIADNAMMYADIFMRIIPTRVMLCTPVIRLKTPSSIPQGEQILSEC